MDGVDLAALLAPIAGDDPAGKDPREDLSANALYLRLRDARNEARSMERLADTAEADERPPAPQWASVSRLAIGLLTTQAKDLEVGSWLAEALLRTDGLAGLAVGFQLLTGLVETWWDDLHPRPDDEDPERRIAPVAGLNGEGSEGTLIQPLRKIPLFPLPNVEMIAFWQYQQSAELATIADPARREQRLGAGVTSFDEIEAAARASAGALSKIRLSARTSNAAWQALEAAFNSRGDAPPMARVRDLLEEIIGIAERHAAPEATEFVPDANQSESHVAGTTEPSHAAVVTGRIATREQAFLVLEEAAEFFRRTEPHSPLAYTLREAVRRGRLTWSELLEEIVPDFDARTAILSSLGIRPPPPSE
jgi:type VI secretion system protein ImpA